MQTEILCKEDHWVKMWHQNVQIYVINFYSFFPPMFQRVYLVFCWILQDKQNKHFMGANLWSNETCTQFSQRMCVILRASVWIKLSIVKCYQAYFILKMFCFYSSFIQFKKKIQQAEWIKFMFSGFVGWQKIEMHIWLRYCFGQRSPI